MDYQKIKYFIKAAETLNFSEAARQMFITPQAFGRQITQLEQEMGFSLFERNIRQIKLTASGKICYEHLHGLVEKLDSEYEKMCEMGNTRKNRIHIGVFQALSMKKVVTPIVTSILASFPNRDINIGMYDMRELREHWENGKVDLCITATHDKEMGWENGEIVLLKKTPAEIVVSGYHKWMVKEEITIEDMREYPVVKMNIPQTGEQDYFVKIPCKEQIVVENYESMCLALEQGNCFSIMSTDIDNYCEKNGKTFPLPACQFDFELALIYNKKNPHALLPEVCQLIKEEFEP